MRSQIGHLTDCENRCRRSWSDFVKLWHRVKEDWRDQRCQRFEQEHLSRLPGSLNRLTHSIHELQERMRQAEKELADPDQEQPWI